MKVRILSRKKIDGKVYRELSCGHEQLEPQGGKSHLFNDAKCKSCGPEPTKTSKPRIKSSKPELSPTGFKAPSRSKVAVRCGSPKQHEGSFAHLKAKCLTCHEWVCGQCEGSNLRVGNRAVPCDKCWLRTEGTTAQVERVNPSPIVPTTPLPPRVTEADFLALAAVADALREIGRGNDKLRSELGLDVPTVTQPVF